MFLLLLSILLISPVLGTEVTFEPSAASDDGYTESSGPVALGWPPYYGCTDYGTTYASDGPAAKSTGQGGTYSYRNWHIRFNTSSLPDDATISAAKLRLYAAGVANTDDSYYVRVEYHSSWPLSCAAHSTNPGAGAHAGTHIGLLSLGAYRDYVLTNLGGISKTGYTSFRVSLTSQAPSGYNLVDFGNHGYASPPQLIVTYSGGEPPPSSSSPLVILVGE